jgi:hypothetical protein
MIYAFMNYIYAQERYLPNLGACKIMRNCLCIMQVDTYRTMARIVQR